MIIAGVYSFNRGREIIETTYTAELEEIKQIIAAVDAEICKTKVSEEVTMEGKILYSPRALNQAFDDEFEAREWRTERVLCDYPTEFYVDGYEPSSATKGAFREMDFIKRRVGVEVQFGKYAFMVYNVCAKMTIFHNMDKIDAGVEIVPVKDLAANMSTGVSYFEQFVWDLEHRGVADIDIPVLILGVAAESERE
ncbi:MAG: restriction endonuclease [Anaerolineae bacterium]|nr:restriction endonuclease [Anaerolineae bacterium]